MQWREEEKKTRKAKEIGDGERKKKRETWEREKTASVRAVVMKKNNPLISLFRKKFCVKQLFDTVSNRCCITSMCDTEFHFHTSARGRVSVCVCVWLQKNVRLQLILFSRIVFVQQASRPKSEEKKNNGRINNFYKHLFSISFTNAAVAQSRWYQGCVVVRF